MSSIELQAALLEILRSDVALAQYENDPHALAERHGLGAAERAHLCARDMGWLYAQSVHPYILAQFALTIGFDMAEYGRQVRAAAAGAE